MFRKGTDSGEDRLAGSRHLLLRTDDLPVPAERTTDSVSRAGQHGPAKVNSHERIAAAPSADQGLQAREIHLGAELAQDLEEGALRSRVGDAVHLGGKDRAQQRPLLLGRSKVGEDEPLVREQRENLKHRRPTVVTQLRQ